MPARYYRRRLQNKVYIWTAGRITARAAVTYIVLLVVFAMVVPVLALWALHSDYQSKVYAEVADLPEMHTGVLLLSQDSTSEKQLRNQAQNAAEAYKQGKLKRVFILGDNSEDVTTAKHLLSQFGVLESSISVDNDAENLGEACGLCRDKFNAESIMIFGSHDLTKDLYICDSMGVDVSGLASADSNNGQNIIQQALGMLSVVVSSHTN